MTDWLIKRFVRQHEQVKDPQVRSAYGRMAGLVGILCNLLLVAGKGLAGYVSGSVSITADALNNLSDASSNIVSLLGFKLAGKPADEEHPYGHARYEYLAGLSVAAIVMIIGFELGKSSIQELLQPTPVVFSWLSVGVLSVSIAVKLWMMRFNRRLGKLIASDTLRATAADSRNDVITTAAVLLAALTSHFFGVELDGWMGLGVAGFILYSGFGLIRDTLDPLLGKAPDAELVRSIHEKVTSYPGVLGTHDLLVHDYGPGRRFASVHVEMAAQGDVMQNHEVIDDIERDFLRDEGLHMIVHLDPIITRDAQVADLRLWLSEKVKQIHPALTIHDVRILKGNISDSIIFDATPPPDLRMEDAQLKRALSHLVQKEYPTYGCIITIDRDYAALPTPAPGGK